MSVTKTDSLGSAVTAQRTGTQFSILAQCKLQIPFKLHPILCFGLQCNMSQKCIDMIYLLTVIGLSTGDSSTVHIYAQTLHRTTQQSGRVRAVARLG